MEDKKLAIILLVVAVLMLGFVLYVNSSGIFDSLENPLFGEGLGALCKNEVDCIKFCQNSRGLCENYCRENAANELCNKLFLG